MKLLPIFGVSMALLQPAMAAAYVPVPQAMACMLYFKSDVVFTGQVLGEEPVKGTAGGTDGWVYTLQVLKPYRNAKAATLKVFTTNDPGKLSLVVGKQYLLFAYNQDGRLTVGNDGLSGELKDAQPALKDLDKIMTHGPDDGGDIYGRVTKRVYGPNTGGLSGIPVTIQGPIGNIRVVTDESGWFKAHVSAGTYSAMALSPGWRFQSQDIAWEDASAFQVPDGGCAEIQIAATPAASE
ncbi:MAG TPA: hypothetical protein VGH91_11150 [Gammaproteobacteria bacterium]|jgi:hypothetical protein